MARIEDNEVTGQKGTLFAPLGTLVRHVRVFGWLAALTFVMSSVWLTGVGATAGAFDVAVALLGTLGLFIPVFFISARYGLGLVPIARGVFGSFGARWVLLSVWMACGALAGEALMTAGAGAAHLVARFWSPSQGGQPGVVLLLALVIWAAIAIAPLSARTGRMAQTILGFAALGGLASLVLFAPSSGSDAGPAIGVDSLYSVLIPTALVALEVTRGYQGRRWLGILLSLGVGCVFVWAWAALVGWGATTPRGALVGAARLYGVVGIVAVASVWWFVLWSCVRGLWVNAGALGWAGAADTSSWRRARGVSLFACWLGVLSAWIQGGASFYGFSVLWSLPGILLGYAVVKGGQLHVDELYQTERRYSIAWPGFLTWAALAALSLFMREPGVIGVLGTFGYLAFVGIERLLGWTARTLIRSPHLFDPESTLWKRAELMGLEPAPSSKHERKA